MINVKKKMSLTGVARVIAYKYTTGIYKRREERFLNQKMLQTKPKTLSITVYVLST